MKDLKKILTIQSLILIMLVTGSCSENFLEPKPLSF